MIYILDGVDITGQQFSKDSVLYPYNWCEIASSTELAQLGIITLFEIKPSLEEGEYYDNTYTDDFIALTRTYNKSITPSE